jgi:hypothetical protein
LISKVEFASEYISEESVVELINTEMTPENVVSINEQVAALEAGITEMGAEASENETLEDQAEMLLNNLGIKELPAGYDTFLDLYNSDAVQDAITLKIDALTVDSNFFSNNEEALADLTALENSVESAINSNGKESSITAIQDWFNDLGTKISDFNATLKADIITTLKAIDGVFQDIAQAVINFGKGIQNEIATLTFISALDGTSGAKTAENFILDICNDIANFVEKTVDVNYIDTPSYNAYKEAYAATLTVAEGVTTVATNVDNFFNGL